MKRVTVILTTVAAVVLILSMVDFSVPAHKHTDQELAQGCFATVDQFNAASAEAKAVSGASPVAFGRCTLSKRSDGRLELRVVESKSGDRQ